MIPGLTSRRRFSDLSDQEVLALAISSEEDDARIYETYAERLREDYPAVRQAVRRAWPPRSTSTARRLIELHKKRFGETIPLIRREHVAGYLCPPPGLAGREPRPRAHPRGSRRAWSGRRTNFYLAAAKRTEDADTRKLLGDLAAAEGGHSYAAERLEREHLPEEVREDENRAAHRQFILTWVQPGLAGLMDGSVSTLAPIFATAFATQDTHTTLLVGLAASVGAGISMGFTEAVHDDGVLSGRGSPFKRGIASGVMTTLGGLGHALPYLIPDFWTATTLAMIIVFVELWAIAWIQNKYMETPFLRAAFQVVLGGALVFAAGVLIGGG